jgi:hypothetical protein
MLFASAPRLLNSPFVTVIANPMPRFQELAHSSRLFSRLRPWLGPLVAALAAVLVPTASAQLKLEAAPEYFYWQEELDGGKLLDESGFRFGFELSYKPPRDTGWLWAVRGKLYLGSVDYNGALQLADDETIPLKSTTDYYGGLLEGRYGYRFPIGQTQFLDLMAGIGADLWLRRLGGPGGYDEFWAPIYLKAGLDLASRETGWLGAVGLKLPVYTTEVSNVSGTVTLHPGPMVSGYAEAGYQFTRNFSATAFFDSYWFTESSVQSGWFQPESKSYQVGAKLGWTF